MGTTLLLILVLTAFGCASEKDPPLTAEGEPGVNADGHSHTHAPGEEHEADDFDMVPGQDVVTVGQGGAGADPFPGWGGFGLPAADPGAVWTQLVAPAQLPDGNVWAISLAPDGDLLIGTSTGLCRRVPAGTLTCITSADGLYPARLVAVEARGPGEVLVGYGYSGHDLDQVFFSATSAMVINRRVTTEASAEVVHEVFRIKVDRSPERSDHAWLGTNEGLALFLGGDPILQHRHPRHPHGASTGLDLDPLGGVWDGDSNQLSHLDYATGPTFYAAPWVEVVNLFPEETDNLMDIALDADGLVWAASLGQGLGWLDPVARERGSLRPPAVPSLSLISVAVAPDGAVWVGSSGSGAARLAGGVTTFHNSSGTLRADSIRAIEIGPDGTVLLGTEEGVWQLRP